MVQYLECGMFVVVSDHQRFGAHQAGRYQHFVFARIAIHHALARRRRLMHAARIEIERDEADASSRQESRQRLAAAAVAADDDVRVLAMLFTAIWCICMALSIHSDGDRRRTMASVCWIRNGATSMEISIAASTFCITSSGSRLQLARQCQQHKTEFARLRQTQAAANRGAPLARKPARTATPPPRL